MAAAKTNTHCLGRFVRVKTAVSFKLGYKHGHVSTTLRPFQTFFLIQLDKSHGGLLKRSKIGQSVPGGLRLLDALSSMEREKG